MYYQDDFWRTWNTYHVVFAECRKAIADNIEIDLGHSDSLCLLIENYVAEPKLRQRLNDSTESSRGKVIVDFLLECNEIDQYEKFLNIWKEVNPIAASNFESQLIERLAKYGLVRYDLPSGGMCSLCNNYVSSSILMSVKVDYLVICSNQGLQTYKTMLKQLFSYHEIVK